MEFSLLGAALIAALGVYAVLWYEAGRTNAADCTRELWDMALGTAVIGVLVGRLVAMIRGGTNPLTPPGAILIVSGILESSRPLEQAVAIGWPLLLILAGVLILTGRIRLSREPDERSGPGSQ